MEPSLDRLLDSLNEQQREAVLAPPGPLLILAGAGSGKTRVLTCRIAYFIERLRISSWNILAVTFTNKAAYEMGERVRGLLREADQGVAVSTFHKACSRILRRHIDRLGFEPDFGILDDTDQVRLLKQVIDELGLDRRLHDARKFRTLIDRAKNRLEGPDDVTSDPLTGESALPDIYRRYQERLKRMNALDFGDLLCHTVTLLETLPDVRAYYRERFRHILVDEYQDTNHAQYRLTRLLVDPDAPSVCVVGDEDQSIYGFRGADVSNIVEFEKDFPGTRVIRLEKNYRSTGRILGAASSVVEHNQYRLGKTLVSVRGEGEFIRYIETDTDYDEAARVAEEILRLHALGLSHDDIAVFYRANFQSRLLEETLAFRRVPYLLVGQGFFDRKEIRDMRAYLQLIYNPADDVALERIINVPARGIGAKAQAYLFRQARAGGVSCYRALQDIASSPAAHKPHGARLRKFYDMMEALRDQLGSLTVPEMIDRVLEESGYRKKLVDAGDPESEGRLENIQEFMNMATENAGGGAPSGRTGLRAFLERIALHAQADEIDPGAGRVTLMTLHNAKGLEFPVVFIVGMEENLFPHARMVESQTDLEEERRLCYVGMTRAMDRLYLLRARRRHIRGERVLTTPSRFLAEVPAELLRGRPRVALHGRAVKLEKKDDTIPGHDRTGPFSDFHIGRRVSHPVFGDGVIERRYGAPDDPRVVVAFDDIGTKRMVLRYSGLELIFE